ncbi:MAG TPA: hypothetical protein VM553_20305 [Dongiaceae bacterium]|nr:hypothetical protein [Dongiaceae bacterium]
MKIKTLLASALTLTACTAYVAWKSVIPGANLTGPALPIATDTVSNSYQLFPVGTALHLRKLSPKGAELWQVPVETTTTESVASLLLRTTSTGAAVSYRDPVTQQAYLKHFDINGNLTWSSDFGEHASETVIDVAVGSDGNLTVGVRLSGTRSDVLRYDSNGNLLWSTAIPACALTCQPALAVDAAGQTLLSNSDLFASKSYLLDSTGLITWNRSRSTGISIAGLVPNAVRATSTGFVISHPLVTWFYDTTGTQIWSQSLGSRIPAVSDASGNVFVATGTKISKLGPDGVTLLEIDLSSQSGIIQMGWREDLQRLFVLTSYNTIGPEIDATITNESGTTLFAFDAAGAKKGSIKSTPTQIKTPICVPGIDCTISISTIYGESWSSFVFTADRKAIVSGIKPQSERFARAYKFL